MEIKDIVPFVLLIVLCGLLLGTGILILDQFSRNVRDQATYVDTAQNLSTGTSVTLSQTYCLSVTSIGNATTTFDLTQYNVSFSNADACTVSYSPFPACSLPTCNVTYVYGASNAGAAAGLNIISAVSPVATTWLGLIVTVAILSIILGMIITSFAQRR
jgi:hypothetical protein